MTEDDFRMSINKIKKMFSLLFVLVITLHTVYAHTEQDFTEAEQLINSKISCDKLTESQFELMGDYYMEQMHPGEAHELMDKMMGGEGSESLKQMHIQMAKRLYCNEDAGGMMGGGMMNMMIGNNMLQGGMMQMMGGGMMNPLWTNNYGYYSTWYLISPIASLILFTLIIYFGYKTFNRQRKDNKWFWLLIGSILLFILFGSFGMSGIGMMMGLGFSMFLIMLLFWGMIIWLIVLLVKSFWKGNDEHEEPLTILKKRFAKGEITKKEFEDMKKELRV